MNRSGSGTRITEEVRKVIYQVWKVTQDKLLKTPDQKLSVKKLLDDVNMAIRSKNLRLLRISKSQLYVEVKNFTNNMKEIDPLLDKPFDLGIFIREYGNQIDAVSVKYIFAIFKAYEVEYGNEEIKYVVTNRQALWIAKLYELVIDLKFFEDDQPIDDFDEKSPKVKGYIWALEGISHTYAMYELMFDTIGEPFNSIKLDYALASGNWEDWNSASIDFLFDDSNLMKRAASAFQQRKVKSERANS